MSMREYSKLIVLSTFGLTCLVCLGTGAYNGSLYAPPHKQYSIVGETVNRVIDYRGPTESLPDIAGVPSVVERLVANPTPISGQDHEKRDLAAQESMAVWAFWMTVTAILTFAVTTFGTLMIWQQVKLTKTAVKDTTKATDAMDRQTRLMANAQRPWLDFDIVEIHPAPYTQNDTLTIILTMSNHSSFPAHQVQSCSRGHFCSSSLLQPLGLQSSKEEVKAVLDEWAEKNAGEVVFPGKEHSLNVNCDISDPEFFKGKSDIMVRITVGIRYTFEGGGIGYMFRDYVLIGVDRPLELAHSYQLDTRKNRWRFGVYSDSLIGRDDGEPWWIPSPCSV